MKKFISFLRETYAHLAKNIVPPAVVTDMSKMK